jgi:hypothetical protein
VRDLKPMLLSYAARWESLAEPLWRERYETLYRKPIAEAHSLSKGHEREHRGMDAGPAGAAEPAAAVRPAAAAQPAVAVQPAVVAQPAVAVSPAGVAQGPGAPALSDWEAAPGAKQQTRESLDG